MGAHNNKDYSYMLSMHIILFILHIVVGYLMFLYTMRTCGIILLCVACRVRLQLVLLVSPVKRW